MLKRLFDLFKRDRRARAKGERDAPADMGDPTSRATGGGSEAPVQDSHSTTGTTSSDTFVGRAGGDEAGDVGPSGGEVRTGQTDLSHQGAARDE
ncbi:MAG: hypothetical protein JWP74_3461 [Marmoricola sp.]|nr:hypothetical protein [Marmoricola sp.]